MKRIGTFALLLACLTLATNAHAQTKVRLAVGGQPALFYLPLNVTDRLGYFKDEGLDVEISDLAGGAKALQALMGGSAFIKRFCNVRRARISASSFRIASVASLLA